MGVDFTVLMDHGLSLSELSTVTERLNERSWSVLLSAQEGSFSGR